MTVKLRNTGWELGGTYLPWIWGQINYWDIERSRWHDVLKTYIQAGHAVVSTSCVPRIHQIGTGEYDFGQVRPQNDIIAFLTEAKELGVKVVLWVGPRDCPGVAAAGYPDELLTDEAALARDANGNFILSGKCFGGEIFTLPCLVSDRLTQVLQPFAEKLFQTIQGWIHPDGPIIGIGLTQAPGWKAALPAFAADYHSEAVEHYHAFLKRHYSKIAHLNQVYNTSFTSFSAIHPPQSNETVGGFPEPRLLDWARFREDYFINAAEKLHALFSKLTLDRIPVFLATLPSVSCPANLEELEKTRCFHYLMPEYPLEERDSLALLKCVSQNRFLTVWNSRYENNQSVHAEEERFRQMQEIAFGARGWDALSPAGTGVVPGFISNRQGVPVRPRLAFWETLQNMVLTEGLLNSQLYGEAVLLTYSDLERAVYLQKDAQARFDLIDIKPDENLSWRPDAETDAYRKMYQTIEMFLLKNQFPFLLADGQTSMERWSKIPLFIAPGSKRMPESVQQNLAQMHTKGNTIVIVGELPEHPAEATFTSLKELVELKPKKSARANTKGKAKTKTVATGRLFHLAEYDEGKLLRLLQQVGVQRPLIIEHPDIMVFFHRHRNRIFISAINPTHESIESIVRRDGKFVLKDFWQESKYWGGNNEIKVLLPPRNVKFWELIPC